MLFHTFSVFLCLSLLLSFVLCEDWTHHIVLDGNGKYHLYWKPPEDKNAESKIIFKAEVQAKGFVGFGLSSNGGMAGSDIVTGWIKDGKTYFQDRHGIGNTLPPKDEKQDWTLLNAAENDTHTILTFSRKLDTCDENDMVIDDSTVRLIYSYSDIDPKYSNPFYHSKNRGSKSVMLLQTPPKKHPIQDDSSLMHWDIQSPDVDISQHRTLYWCKIFRSPELSTKHHIVKFGPLIQEGHDEFVHHILLYECVGGTDEEYEDYIDFPGHECYHPNMPDAMKKCDGVVIVWAIGGNAISFPEHVGFPLEPAPGKFYMLEIHYDNPTSRQGIVDHSGLRMYYTSNLRQYDSGCIMVGSFISPTMFIPPGQQKYEVTGHSNPECLQSSMPSQGVKALGIILHAHLLGRRLKARHFRGDKELPPLAEDKNYDFNYQEYRYFKEEIEILPGDQISVECTYDSRGRDKVTFGGLSTEDEMCVAFVIFYPRIDRYMSLSGPTFSTINELLSTNFTDPMSVYSLQHYDWNTANIDEMGKRLKYSEHSSRCYTGNGEKNTVKSLISYPRDLQSFIPEKSACKKA